MSEMFALVMTRPGGPEVLEIRRVEKPRLRHDTDILIKVVAAGVNPADWQNRKSGAVHGEPGQDPFTILGIDGAGIVEAVGSGITHLREGDPVWYVDGGYAGNFGSYAEYKVLNGLYATLKPKNLGFIEAAALPTVALTAWEAVFNKAQVRPGETALVHGGAGGLGHITIQYLRDLGARIATTVSTEAKAQLVTSLGADYVINYRETDVLQAFRSATGLSGADVVFDFVGHENFAASFGYVAPYGRLINTVVSSWPVGGNELAEWNNLDISFVNIGYPQVQSNHVHRARQAKCLEQIAQMAERNALRPHIDRVVSFGEVGSAHDALESGQTLGRVVLSISSDE